MRAIFQSKPLWPAYGLALARILTAAFLIYHGAEIWTKPEAMKSYLDWDQFKNLPSPQIWVYAGKAFELLAGILLLIGLWTRFASLILIGTMCYIAFFVGKGEVWYADQHPFLFVLLGWIFLCCGPGALSLDRKK
ncbi:MAG: DoxX family protein [Chitinophagaceae bacterium]